MVETSKELIEFIKKKEGFRANAYKDGNGYSIGYGHWKPNPKQKIEIDTDTGVDIHYNEDTTIDEKCAEDYLLQDIKRVIADIGRVCPSFISLEQGKRDALTSLVYNWGLAPFTRSKLLKYLKQHDYKSAAHEFLDVNKSGGKVLAGLTKRRQEEADIFLYGW